MNVVAMMMSLVVEATLSYCSLVIVAEMVQAARCCPVLLYHLSGWQGRRGDDDVPLP